MGVARGVLVLVMNLGDYDLDVHAVDIDPEVFPDERMGAGR